MKFKSAFAAIAATTALTGAVFLAETVQAKPCIFSQPSQATDSAPPSVLTDPTTTQADLGNLSKLGIVGASFTLLGGFLTGGVMLKRRFDRKAEPLPEADQAEVLPDPLPQSLVASSEFAIEIPSEVLQSLRDANASESELDPVR